MNPAKKILPSLSMVFLAVLFMNCSGFNAVATYRDARRTFNDAAARENGIQLGRAFPNSGLSPAADTKLVPVTPGMADDGRTEAAYRSALAQLEAIDPGGEEELQRYGLLLDKLLLQSLCLLRLKQYDRLESLIDHTRQLADAQVQNETDDRNRHSYLLQALPGLIMNDQAYSQIPGRMMSNTALFQKIEQLLIGPGDHALKHLSDARRAAFNARHPVRLYLMQTELAAYRNLMGAYTFLQPNRTGRPTRWNQTEARPAANRILKCLKALEPSSDHRLFQMWWNTFGQPVMGDGEACDMD